MNDADAAKRSVSYYTEGKFFLRLNPIIGECGAIRYGAEARLADRPTPRKIPSAASVNMRRGFGLRLNGFRGSRRAFRLSRLRPPRAHRSAEIKFEIDSSLEQSRFEWNS